MFERLQGVNKMSLLTLLWIFDNVAVHRPALLHLCAFALLVHVRRVDNAFFQRVPYRRLKGACLGLLCLLIVVFESSGHAAIVNASLRTGQGSNLSVKQVQAIRRACKLEPYLSPFVTKTSVVECRDFEAWLQAVELGDSMAESYTRKQTGTDSK